MNDWWAAPMLRRFIRGSVRRELAGVWVSGPLPAGGCVLAPNHHSWWDGYVLLELAWQQSQAAQVMMTERQLARFPFLRLAGAVGTGQLRLLVRAAQAGAWVVVFPEGAIQNAGQVRAWHPGAAWLARAANVPAVPVALRLAMRGAQWPGAFVRFGAPCSPDDLQGSLNTVLAQLDADLAAADPESPPAGYLRWVPGKLSAHDRVALPARLLAALSEVGRQ